MQQNKQQRGSQTRIFQHLAMGISLLGLLFSMSACEGFFGKKVDSSFIDVPVYNERQVAYVPIQPVWEGFALPEDITIGYDELIYIVDAGTEEIISLDQAGNELGRYALPGVKEVVQDRSLDLLAIATFDTLGYSLPAIYRIDMKGGGGYGLGNAEIVSRNVHPFYYKVNLDPGNDDLVSLNGIALKANNEYFVARSGPGSSQIFGPDDAMLVFNGDDEFLSTIRVSTGGGVFDDYFRTPVAAVGVAQPPQSPSVNASGDFIFASGDAATQLKVQYIEVNESENGIDYTVKDMVTGDTSKADDFLLRPGRFGLPTDLAYTGDGTNYIFVVDAEKDSLYQFTSTGLEGVEPPPGSNSPKNLMASFGGRGTGLTQFNQPSAVAYYRQILYVADRGNQRILRFRLTTDFD